VLPEAVDATTRALHTISAAFRATSHAL